MASFLLSSFNVIIFLFNAVTPKSTATSCAATSAVRSLTAMTYSCTHPSALDAAHSAVIDNKTFSRQNSQIECVRLCFDNNACTAATHVKHTDGATATCFLLGGISGTPVVLEDQQNTNNMEAALARTGEQCSVFVMNPCPGGVKVSRGHCECPEGLAGPLCEITNPAECSSTWTNVYSTNGTGDTNTVLNTNTETNGGYLKVALRNKDGSALVLHGNFFFLGHGLPFATQVSRTLTRKSWDEFDDAPEVSFLFVRSDGSVQAFTGSNTTKDNSQMLRADWFVRQPHNPHELDYSNISLAMTAVRNGQAVVTYNAVHLMSSDAKMLFTRYQYEISRGTPYNFPSNPYWINTKYTWLTGGTVYKIKNYVVGGTHMMRETRTNRGVRTLNTDPCWTRASTDRLGDSCNSDGNTVDITATNIRTFPQLVAATFNGHLARVLVGDTALTVDQVAIAGDVAVFGALPYLDPVDDGAYAQGALETRIVAVTDGQVFTCKTPQSGQATYTNTTMTGEVTWFVDTRYRSRILSVTSNGKVLRGSETGLYEAVVNGATVHVGVLFPEQNHYLLLRITAVEAAVNGHVVAQAEGLSSLPILNGRVTSGIKCGLRALLVTSQGIVRLYEYRHRETKSGIHSTLTNLTVDWFVDSHA